MRGYVNDLFSSLAAVNAHPKSGLKGFKQQLPTKPCLACGRLMSWRKAWAKNWEQVKYCSDACRRHKPQASPP